MLFRTLSTIITNIMINLVRDHAKSPIPTTPSLVAVVIWRVVGGRHVGRVAAIPATVDVRTRGREVGAVLLVRTPELGRSFLPADLVIITNIIIIVIIMIIQSS